MADEPDIRIELKPPRGDWRDPRVEFRKGTFSNAALPKDLTYLGLPNPRKWSPTDLDWQLPPDWKRILLDGMKDRLARYRSFRLFMDMCVRCGACADKCHFYLGSGDPKNMPFARTELVRSIYRRYFTLSGRLFGSLAGARDLTEDVVKEWFYYFYQCTECRRCSIFCPFGIDTAEVTMIMRELLISIGVGTHWITEPAAKCFRVSNHLGIAPHALRDGLEFARDELRDITGLDIEIPISRKGAEVLFVMPSADYFATPHYYTLLGYMMLFHEIGLDYTVSAYASEGGNFGLFHSNDLMKGLNAKIYDEAKRLGVKWILGGECGHMWRVLHQYMDTMNGPADFLEVPVSPITGTRFEHAASTRAVHICEFTADLIHHGKLRLNPARNDEYIVTFHDSCNPARAMGLLEEPRHVLKHVCNRFHEMAANTIREYTFCCGSGAGIGNDESLEIRLRGGFPRAVAVRQVREEHGVNLLACICAIDKATLPTAMDYWVPGVQVAGVHELLGNALVMRGEKERTTNLRGEPLAKEAANA